MLNKFLNRFRKPNLGQLNRAELAAYRRERARILRRKGTSPTEIAKELGVARSTVYDYL